MRAVGRVFARNRTLTPTATGRGCVLLSFAQRDTALRGSAAVGIAQSKVILRILCFIRFFRLIKMSYDSAAAAADLAVASRWILVCSLGNVIALQLTTHRRERMFG